MREDVIGNKPASVAHAVSTPTVSSSDRPLGVDEIAALDQDELDAMLEDSISSVLKSGGRA